MAKPKALLHWGLQSMVAIRNNNMVYGIAKSYKEKTNPGSDTFPKCIGREELDLIQEGVICWASS